MSIFFEIAYAAASGSLCLFTGTGFSKEVTEGMAPSWQQLLEDTCQDLKNADDLRNALFGSRQVNRLSLPEAAQIIAIQRQLAGVESLHHKIASIIGGLAPQGDNSAVSNFLSTTSLDVVTTNYDKLLESLVHPDECTSIAAGLPVPRTMGRVRVFHIHGSVDAPSSMVVTADNYFEFIRNESYLSRKLSTLLHEDTVVILGYSLGDASLRAILSDYRMFVRDQVVGSSILFVSKDPVNQYVKDYYADSYGIRVIDNTSIPGFFSSVSNSLPAAKSCLSSSLDNAQKALSGSHTYSDDYLKIRTSFFEIIAAIRAIGRSINDSVVVRVMGNIIARKIKFTSANGAWEQYADLAHWLIYLGAILEIRNTSIESIYLQAVQKSMTSMTRRKALGYSWHAYAAWDAGWFDLAASNRSLVREYMIANASSDPDVRDIVARG